MIEGGQRAGFAEFVALMATLMSLVALSIDAMLPALGEIGRELGAGNLNSVQLVVSVMFLGMAAGQLFYGPLSDSVGRKPALLAGLALYAVGCLISLFSRSFSVMLAGRLVQGLGAAGPRIVSIALIRDLYDGRRMARVMSLVMAIFIAVPIVAPALGQAILLVASWRAIFGVFLSIAAVASVWFTLRQGETLAPGRRIPFTRSRIVGGLREVLGSRTAVGYAITAGLVLGGSVGYLSTAQQVFQEQYGLGRRFPLYFALLATALGAASLLNAHLVTRFRMRPLARGALLAVAGLSVTFFAIAYSSSGHPPLWALVAYLFGTFLFQGTLFGNLTALAMKPLAHIAGMGAAVVGALSTFISALGGIAIGRAYDGTVLPLVAGFGGLALAALAVMSWTEPADRVA
jgi:DHA1 family bicyclomycin/chloramphenicol resistance-like MFS transporter